MPSYRKVEWNGYIVRLYPEERDVLRAVFFLVPSIVPFFWDTSISLDMTITPPKNIRQIERSYVEYRWELHDLDNKVVESGRDTYEFQSYLKVRKHHAVRLGFLKPQQGYRLDVTLTDMYGTASNPLPSASFTVKDRDEVYTQVFISLITILMGIIIGLLVRGCS